MSTVSSTKVIIATARTPESEQTSSELMSSSKPTLNDWI